jgi:mycothiol synthase
MKYRGVKWPADGPSLGTLFAAAAAVDGRPALTEHKALHATPLASGHIGVVGMLDGGVAAYAQASPHPGGWGIEAVVCPDQRRPDVYTGLIARTVSMLPPGAGYGVWAVDETVAQAARHLGLVEHRALHQLRRPLPAREGAVPDGFTVRPFSPDVDTDSLLEVNNLAFADHPENAAMSRDDLALRMRQGWFDPQGLLLGWHGEALAGFCWMKSHDGDIAEIYIIGVRPDRHGSGLGTALALLGLAQAHRRGASVGMLYVEADNHAGLGLYASLGFEIHLTNRMYGPPAGVGSTTS